MFLYAFIFILVYMVCFKKRTIPTYIKSMHPNCATHLVHGISEKNRKINQRIQKYKGKASSVSRYYPRCENLELHLQGNQARDRDRQKNLGDTQCVVNDACYALGCEVVLVLTCIVAISGATQSCIVAREVLLTIYCRDNYDALCISMIRGVL